jgi:signal transduction histidine kinase
MIVKYREFRNSLKESFSVRVFRSFAISIMIVFVIFTLFFVAYERNIVREDLIKEGKMLAGLTAYSSTTGVFAENRDLVKDSVQGIMRQKNVLAVAIFTAGNKALLIEEKSHGKTARSFLSPDEMRTGPLSGERSARVIDGLDTISIISPVIMETPENPEEALYFAGANTAEKREVIGYVRVVMNKRVLDEKMKAALFRSAVIALLFLVLSAVVMYISIRRVTRPLTSLNEAVRRLGMGEDVGKVPVVSKDEIGKLAATFNTMSENLKRREEEKKALEEKLRYAQKMEAVGTLARGIAHDFNNILSTVRGSIYILEKKFTDQGTLRQYTGQIHNSLNKAKNLIGSLIAFSRIQSIQTRIIDLDNLTRKLRPILASIAGENIEVRLSLSEAGLFIAADAVQMEQVLMNLCTNARDAMPDGGILTIRTEPAIIEGGETERRALMKPGRYALISVEDTGTGIEEEIKEKIFEPFFSTKEVGKGTGLGLAIVYGIIEQHKGYLDIISEKEKGTTFKIYLPLAEQTGENAAREI